MVVAVTADLQSMGQELRQRGHKVVVYGQYGQPIDAVVYSGSHPSVGAMTASNFSGDGGVLMIPAGGRTAEQIHQCLLRKTYSPLIE